MYSSPRHRETIYARALKRPASPYMFFPMSLYHARLADLPRRVQYTWSDKCYKDTIPLLFFWYLNTYFCIPSNQNQGKIRPCLCFHKRADEAEVFILSSSNFTWYRRILNLTITKKIDFSVDVFALRNLQVHNLCFFLMLETTVIVLIFSGSQKASKVSCNMCMNVSPRVESLVWKTFCWFQNRGNLCIMDKLSVWVFWCIYTRQFSTSFTITLHSTFTWRHSRKDCPASYGCSSSSKLPSGTLPWKKSQTLSVKHHEKGQPGTDTSIKLGGVLGKQEWKSTQLLPMAVEAASPVHINFDRQPCPSLSIIYFLQFCPKRRLLKAWLRFRLEKYTPGYHMRPKEEVDRYHDRAHPFSGSYETTGCLTYERNPKSTVPWTLLPSSLLAYKSHGILLPNLSLSCALSSSRNTWNASRLPLWLSSFFETVSWDWDDEDLKVPGLKETNYALMSLETSQSYAESTTCWSRVTWLTWAPGVPPALASDYITTIGDRVFFCHTSLEGLPKQRHSCFMASFSCHETGSFIRDAENWKKGGYYFMRKRELTLVHPKRTSILWMSKRFISYHICDRLGSPASISDARAASIPLSYAPLHH